MTLDRYHRTYGHDLVDTTKKKFNALLMLLSNEGSRVAVQPQQQNIPDLNIMPRMGDP